MERPSFPKKVLDGTQLTYGNENRPFPKRGIRRTVAALTDSVNPAGYLKDMRRRDEGLAEAFKGGRQIATPLGLEFDTAGGRQVIQCWNTEGIFRLIQSLFSLTQSAKRPHNSKGNNRPRPEVSLQAAGASSRQAACGVSRHADTRRKSTANSEQ
jgi:hypothetical protein